MKPPHSTSRQDKRVQRSVVMESIVSENFIDFSQYLFVIFIQTQLVLCSMYGCEEEKNPKFPFRTLERPTSLFYLNKQDTQTVIAYLDPCTDILY